MKEPHEAESASEAQSLISESENPPKKSVSRRMPSREEKALMETFRDNFLFALEHRPAGRPLKPADVARKMQVSKSVVSSWTRPKSLPSVPQLVALSKLLGRDVKWMLEKHAFAIQEAASLSTYTDIFSMLLLLIDRHAIDQSGITDYFLRYMVNRFYEIRNLKQVSDSDKDLWFQKIYASFDIEILPQLPEPRMYNWLEQEYQQFDKDTTALKVLELVKGYWDGTKKNELDDFFDNCMIEQAGADERFDRPVEIVWDDEAEESDDFSEL